MKGEKTGGRKKGTPNKVTQEHRELINRLIDSPNDLEKDLKKLSPKDRLDSIIKLLQFTTPKQSRVVADVTNKVNISSIKFEDA